ncbi:hypothetical protein [Streptomyces sp. NRRL F-5135]|uniref:hypothetical protein n=1 Tax=Streptomyces sp. NRRL F-5135 TaxID=1463858 RepID=UPI0004C55082|nr:hypothetical protein [Streptomyces sp. NRRL F-5135]
MPPEGALLESRSMRDSVMGRVDALDKVKALVMLPDGIHVRSEDVARYFEVSTGVIRQLTARHRAELTANGMRVLRGSDLRRFHSDMVSLWADGKQDSYPQAATQLTLHRMSCRLDTLDRRLDATNRVVAAIGNRLCEMSDDIKRVDARVDDVAHQLRDLRRNRKRR